VKVTIYTFAEDTDSGTDSRVFGTESARNAHLKQVMLDSYNRDAENPVVTVEPDGNWTTKDDGEQDTIALLNSGDITGAFLEWNENSPYRLYLDTYNFDDEEIEVAIPSTDALVAALQVARRTFTNDPNDYEWLEHHMVCKKDILKQIDEVLAGVLQTTSARDVSALNLLREIVDEYGAAVAADEPIDGGNMVEFIGPRIVEAQKLLVATPETALLKVVVEVSGGVAEATDVPAGVTVQIVDHDNEKVGE
jgi:hypothetical protein